MGIDRPFRRTVRQLSDGSYAHSGNGDYITHPAYSKDADKYVRAYLLIQADMLRVFDYVAAADVNLTAYSFRMHEIIVRSCIEVEANFKAILRDNGYTKTNSYNVFDFLKTEPTHRLSEFKVKFPYWDGKKAVRKPFSAFKINKSPHWYRAYNATKHDRHENFQQANMEAMIDSVAGLAILLAAQYRDEDFSPIAPHITFSVGHSDGYTGAIGNYFRISYPSWPATKRYDFNWERLQGDADPFRSHNYS